LGAGGTTSAIAAALTSLGANLIILNRTPEKAKNLAQRLNDYYKRQSVLSGSRSLIAEWAADAKVIIAAIDEPDSPLYQYSALGEILLPASQENIAYNLADARAIMRNLLPTTIISDVMLRTDDTATVREAKLAGFLTLDGFPMVLNQGIEAFWLVNESVLRTKPISKDQVALAMQNASRN
jgi:shikimate dehydrogenase